MSKKLRYLLIFFLALCFLIAAPLIVFFARGLKFDFAEKKFVATGILVVKSEPKEVNLYLNGKLRKTTSGEIRFLKPGNYILTVQKDGFYSWNKIIHINPDMVVNAHPEGGKIQLLASNQTVQSRAEGILNFLASEQQQRLAALTDNSLQIIKTTTWEKTQEISLSSKVSKIYADWENNLFLLTSEARPDSNAEALLYNSATGQIFDLKPLFNTNSKPGPTFALGPQGRLLGLFEDDLYLIDAQNLSRHLLFSDVKAYKLQGQILYYVSKNEKSAQLRSADLATGEQTLILDNLPDFKKLNILVSPQKTVFLLIDDKLYALRINGLAKLAENIVDFDFENPMIPMTFLSKGELWIIDSFGTPVFITRSAGGIAMPKFRPDFGYVIFMERQKLIALELDTRGGQNRYELYEGKNIQKYQLDETAQNLLILDDGILKTLKIR